MKKGFTLIELLAVIAVLAVILLIALSYVLNMIEKSKIEAFKNNGKMINKAAINYLSANPNLLPALNSKIEISIDTLKTNNYLTNIFDPKDNSICSGYVVVTNLNNEYKYNPYLNCENTLINNSSDDRLLLHYTFDDYEEPTVNIAGNAWGIYAPYHSLVQNGTTLTFTMIGSNRYIVINQPSMGALQNRTFSFSGYMKKNGAPYIPSSNRFSTYNLSASISNYYTDPATGYFEGTMLFDSTSSWLLHWPVANIDGDIITIENFQVEEKPYPTRYTPNTRTGMIYDSVSNNNVALSLSNTPFHVKNGIKGSAYHFQTSSRLTMPLQMNNTNYGLTSATYTYSTWINLKRHNASGVGLLLGMAYYSGFGIAFSSDGATYTRFNTYFRNSTAQYHTANSTLELNKWYHIVSVLDRPNNLIKFYLNGSLFATNTITTTTLGHENYPFGLNLISEPGGSGPFVNLDALIDEIKIYNRVLSDSEIKEIYDQLK